MDQKQKRSYLIKYMLEEKGRAPSFISMGEEKDKRLLRSLFNTRPPKEADPEFLRIQSEYLREETRRKGITDVRDIKPLPCGIKIFHGDITALRCGAIVNAANKKLLGCFTPCHGCADNAVHTYAGTELRLRCSNIIKELGREAEVSEVFVTCGYNLPCDFIMHTLGPAPRGLPSEEHIRQLNLCYTNCLDEALRLNIKSIAFCCISSGVFGFPKRQAAETAINAVMDHPAFKKGLTDIVFALYDSENLRIYNDLLK